MKANNRKGEVLIHVLYACMLMALFVLFAFVFFKGFGQFEGMFFIQDYFGRARQLLLMGAGILIAYFLGAYLYKKILGINDKVTKALLICTFSLMVILQLLFLIKMKVNLRYDALKVLDEAVRVCKTGQVSPESWDGYFARYTNNYAMLFLTVFWLKAGRFLGVLNANFDFVQTYVGILNIILLDTSLLFLLAFVKRLWGKKAQFFYCLVVFFQPLFYIWVPFYYTNIAALPFLCGILLFSEILYEKLCEEPCENLCGKPCEKLCEELCEKQEARGTRKKVKYTGCFLPAFLLGICIFAGGKLRATTYIACIAVALVWLLKLKKRGNIKKIMLIFLGIFVAAVLSIGSYKGLTNRYVKFDWQKTAFPMVHWINMGAAGEGTYSIADELATMAQPTYELKKEMNKQVFSERFNELGFSGYIRLMFHKLNITFSDGTAGYHAELGVSDTYNDANMYLLGGKSDLIGFLMQSQYVLALGCALLYLLMRIKQIILCIWPSSKQAGAKEKILIGQLKREDEGKQALVESDYKNAFKDIILLTLFGGFLFQMIWEAGNIYSLTFLSLYPLLTVIWFTSKTETEAVLNVKEESACEAGKLNMTETLKEVTKKESKEKVKLGFTNIAGLLGVILMLVVIISAHGLFTEIMYETNDAVVNQYIYEWGDVHTLESGDAITQTFLANRPFNRISLQVRNLIGPDNDGSYLVKLASGRGELIESFIVNAGEYGDYDFVRLPLSKEYCPKINEKDTLEDYDKTHLSLSIEKICGKEGNSLVFLSYNSGNIDVYSKGNWGDERMKDLCFSVYETKNQPYFSR